MTCPELTSPSNGSRLGCPLNATMYYDTVCQFSCNDGYIGSGSQARRCQDNGTWSGQDFTCQSMYCSLYTSQLANKARANPGLRITKLVIVFLLHLAGTLVHRGNTPSNKFTGTHRYTWVEGYELFTSRVKCLAT